ncbi:SufE family protein [Aliidiomarina sanyensis]|uniref:Fe-S metabolism protein SufE n=1 Tax=Aliidiomarina sanyensis TaxID=1249555 RepID=A0A432WII3_9GAMM|nr:SufE family protein [Aliidiomarina sanyensis]RUO33555.1 Fe-S metabolism protein SufE [Aliidiomarina sanyensis]
MALSQPFPNSAQLQADLIALRQWEQRLRYLLLLGRDYPHTDIMRPEFSVFGCEAAVWVNIQADHSNTETRWWFVSHSESRLVAGLLLVLLAPIQGKTRDEVSAFQAADWLQACGLEQQLSPSRNNGLHRVLKTVKSSVCA